MKKIKYVRLLFLLTIMFITVFQGIPGTNIDWSLRVYARITYSVAHEYDGAPAYDCVAFARYMVPSLPSGLGDLAGKKAIINSYTPVAGAISIESGSSSLGHVAYVESVNGNQITTLHGGFYDSNSASYLGETVNGDHIVRKTGTATELGIIGYYVPNGGSGSNPVVPDTSTWTTSVDNLTETNAKLSARYSAGYTVQFQYAGCNIFDENGNMIAQAGEDTSVNNSYIDIWYDINSETHEKLSLQAGKTYKYQFYATYGGVDHFSPMYTFKTPGTVTPDVSGQKPTVTVSDTGKVSVGFNGVNNVHHYDILLKNTSGTIISYVNIGTASSGTIQIDNGCGNYVICVRAYGSDGTYTNSKDVSITWMGKKVSLGDEFYVNIKTVEGKYFYDYDETNKHIDLYDEIYETHYFPAYVYHFVYVPQKEEYTVSSLLHGEIGQFVIYDDSKGDGYLLAKSGTNQVWQYKPEVQTEQGLSTQKMELEEYDATLGQKQKVLFLDFEKRESGFQARDYYGFWDGEAHTIDALCDGCPEILYRIDETEEWSTEIPTRTDVGTTKVYYKYTHPCYKDVMGWAYITIADKCLIEFETRYNGLLNVIDGKHARSMMCSPQVNETTTFTSYKVITSVMKDGKLISTEKEYGPITIEAGQKRSATKIILVDPVNFGNASGVYTTTVCLTTEEGEQYQGSISYDFSKFSDDVIISMNINDEYFDEDIYMMRLLENDVTTGEVEIVTTSDEDGNRIDKLVAQKEGRVYLSGSDKYSASTGHRWMMIVDIKDTSEPEYQSLEAKKEKVQYGIGELIELEDLEVTATYSDGSTKIVDSYITNISEIDMNSAGEKELIVSYTEGEVTKSVTIKIIVLDEKQDCIHEWNEGEVTVEPSCEEAGEMTYTCTICKKTKTENIDATGHTEVTDEAVAPTCTEKGKSEGSHCSACEAVIVEQKEIAATQHIWDEGKITKSPTVTTEGERLYTCKSCNATKIEKISKLPANDNEETKAPDNSDKQTSEEGQSTDRYTKADYVIDEIGYNIVIDNEEEIAVEIAYYAGAEKYIVIPEYIFEDDEFYKVVSIADDTFKNNKNIKYVVIGDNVKTIGKNAFSGCKNLKTVTVGRNVTVIGSKAFYNCKNLTKITIPSKVTKIDSYAFKNCKKLSSVTIGKAVKTIGKEAFRGCSKLKSINIKSKKLKTVGKNAFKGIKSSAKIKVPSSKLKSYKNLLKNKGQGKKVKITK